jgi:hypothetical protein
MEVFLVLIGSEIGFFGTAMILKIPTASAAMMSTECMKIEPGFYGSEFGMAVLIGSKKNRTIYPLPKSS